MTETTQYTADSVEARAGKYLTFNLGEETYGLEILTVREIIGLMDVTTVPRVPPYIRGVINLRGRIIPVLDLRRKFAMEAVEDTAQTCIIVVEANVNDVAISMGILVDRVREVMDIQADELAPVPAFGGGVNNSFIRSMARSKDQVTILLNTQNVLCTSTVTDATSPSE